MEEMATERFLLHDRNQVLQREIERHEQSRSALEQSMSWRATRQLARLGGIFAPPETGRRRAVKRLARLAVITHREGMSAIPRRLWTHAQQRVIEPLRLRGGQQRPWIPDDRPVFLLAHHGGVGGIARHLRELTVGLREAGVRPVQLSAFSNHSLLWEERGPDGRASWTFQSARTRESITGVLDEIKPAHAHFHSIMKLPETLIELLMARGVSYDWTLHDYYPICPRAHLDRGDGRYCGLPEPATCNACLALLGDYQGKGIGESIESWRERYSGFLRGARRVFAPSLDARLRLERLVPRLCVVVRAHPETLQPVQNLAAAYNPGARVRVAVLGTITAPKGSLLLQACAEDAARNQLPLEFVVLGRTDRDRALSRTGRVRVTGPYTDDDIFQRLSTESCHFAFLPSVVPETHMYTLSTVMRAGLFPVCLELGAQAERLRSWGGGRVLPLEADPAAINRSLIETAESLGEPSAPHPPSTYVDLLDSYYGFTDEERRRFGLSASRSVQAAPQPHLARRNSHARLY
jgi:hypothetical protein